eukprot:439993_1
MSSLKSQETKPTFDEKSQNVGVCSICDTSITEDDYKSGNINIGQIDGITHKQCPHKLHNNNKNACYAVLMDVSGSMQEALTINKEVTLSKKQISGAHAVFNSIFKVMEENKNGNEKLFALAFGLSDAKHQHCDLFSLFAYLLQSYHTKQKCIELLRQYGMRGNINNYIKKKNIAQYTNKKMNKMYQIIGHEPLIEMAKLNGAPYAGEYIKKHLTDEEAGFIFVHFHKHRNLMRTMIDELPSACKSSASHTAVSVVNSNKTKYALWGTIGVGILTVATGGLAAIPLAAVYGSVGVGGAVAQNQTKKAEDTAAKEALERAKELILSPIYDIRKQPRSRQEIISIINKLRILYPLDETKDNNESLGINKLLNDIKPYIFGGTPMCKSIRHAKHIFQLNNSDRKILLIISDGEATDGSPEIISKTLRDEKNVTIVSCFITTEHINNPRQLYDRPNLNWKNGAKTLFDMSSTISNMDRGMYFLLERGWELPVTGECKLFVEANHPDIIDEFCCIVNRLSLDNDAIIDMIGKYEFDKYINGKIDPDSETEIPNQGDTPTCYANAVGTVLHLVASTECKPWLNRGVPDFEILRDELIKEKKLNPKFNTKKILQKYCNKYGLICEKIKDELIARKTIFCKRPMVFVFRLYTAQWRLFNKFFTDNRKGILTKNDLKIDEWEKKEGDTGHAVVLVKCDPKCLVFMNSYGIEWGDKGFFRVKSKDVLQVKTSPSFFDVRVDKLSDKEKQAYKAYCKKETELIINDNVSSAFYKTEYKCEKCGKMSKINEYDGSFMEVICPKCNKSFKPSVKGLITGLYQRGMQI